MNVKTSRNRFLKIAPLLFVIWLLSIFATSSTVIRPEELFSMVNRYALFSETSMHRFKVFWGASWLLVVKGWHFTEFALLLFLCVATIKAVAKRMSPPNVILASAAICIAYAVTDEWHQTFVPDRFGSYWDVLVDSLGVTMASLFLLRRHSRGDCEALFL